MSAPSWKQQQQHQASESAAAGLNQRLHQLYSLIQSLRAAPGETPSPPSVCALFWRNQECRCFWDFWANISCLVTTASGSIMQMEAHKSLYAFWWQQWSEPCPDFCFLKIFQLFVWNWMKLFIQLFPCAKKTDYQTKLLGKCRKKKQNVWWLILNKIFKWSPSLEDSKTYLVFESIALKTKQTRQWGSNYLY